MAAAAGLLAACGGESEQKAAQDTVKIPPDPTVLAEETQALKRRVKALEDSAKQQDAQQRSLDSRLAAVDARLAAVEGSLGLGQAGQDGPSAAAPVLEDLEKRLSRLEDATGPLMAAIEDSGDAAMAKTDSADAAMGDGAKAAGELSLADAQQVAITDGEGGRAVISADQFDAMLQEAVAERVTAELERRLGSQPREYRVLPAAPNEIEAFEPAEPARPTAASGERRYAAHLGSYRHMDRLLQGLERLRSNHDALAGLPVSAADIHIPEKGDFLRLLAGTFERFDDAVALCEDIAAAGSYCEVRRLRSVPRMADAGKASDSMEEGGGESADETG